MNLHQTRDGIIAALTPSLLPQTAPSLLCDVIAMKTDRGDSDIRDFRFVCDEFASGESATIVGAIWAMNQWLVKNPRHEIIQQRRRAFVADCEAVLAGTFGVEFRAVA